MSVLPHDVAARPDFLRFVRGQSQALLQAYQDNPRLSAVFATQQRWLLAHAGLALYFDASSEGPRAPFTVSRFKDMVSEHKIASLNTADAFMQEMLRYRFAERVAATGDKRARPIAPAQSVIQAVNNWIVIHLTTLDQLDDGDRTMIFERSDEAISRLQPAIAARLLASPAVRAPQKTFSLFTWLNSGGLIMEWLVCGLGDPDPGADRIPTAILSAADMAPWLKISLTHLNRKLREAERLGSIGWDGPKDRAPLWVSRSFLNEMLMAQATKLAIIDGAFRVALR